METVRFEVADRVATITLDRPERKNAMNQQMKDDLRACWQRVKAEPDIWAAIVTGAGEAFSSGADVESLATGGFTRPDRWRELAMIEGIRELPTPRRQLVHKPVIAAVNGVVAGFSLDLVTEADIPIASDKATFVDPHVSLGYVSSHEMVNMARRVPVAVCLRMALLGSRERLSAERAYQVGLVTEVVPHARLRERARALAAVVVSNAQEEKRVVGDASEAGVVDLFCAPSVSRLEKQLTQADVRLEVCGVESDGLGVPVDGVLSCSTKRGDLGEADQRRTELGIDLEGRAEVIRGKVQVAGRSVHRSDIGMRTGASR